MTHRDNLGIGTKEQSDCWKRHGETGLLFSRDDATGLRRYIVGGRQYDEVVEGIFVGPEHWDYPGLRLVAEAILDLRWMNPEDRELASRKAAMAGLEYANFGFDDGCLPAEALLQDALQWLAERHGQGIPCLVHCSAGVSRSPFLLCLYLLPRFQWDLEETMRYLVSRRREALPARLYLDYLRRQVSERTLPK